MYPYITIGDTYIYMTSLGVIISVFVFLFFLYKFSKNYNLSFVKFFNYFPIMLFAMYLFGSYVYHILENRIIIPTSFDALMSILFPQGYAFHFIGISFGFLIVFLFFLSKVKYKIERFKWIDTVFYSMMISLFVFGLFLTLGDNFYGKPTNSEIGVSSIVFCDLNDINCEKPVSKIDDFVAVHPIGIYLSIISVILFLLIYTLQFITKRFGFGILGFVLFLLFINIPFIFQNYHRYLPIKVGDYTLDIKNYWTIVLVLFIIIWYIGIYFRKEEI